LLARDIGVRGTIDIDLYREVAREIAEADLRQSAALDIGDWFRFEIGPPRPLVDTGGVRLPVKALVGNAEWAAFHVDLVGEDLRMTGDPEDVPPLARVVMPDLQPFLDPILNGTARDRWDPRNARWTLITPVVAPRPVSRVTP